MSLDGIISWVSSSSRYSPAQTQIGTRDFEFEIDTMVNPDDDDIDLEDVSLSSYQCESSCFLKGG